jgi:hypothetical protein
MGLVMIVGEPNGVRQRVSRSKGIYHKSAVLSRSALPMAETELGDIAGACHNRGHQNAEVGIEHPGPTRLIIAAAALDGDLMTLCNAPCIAGAWPTRPPEISPG